MNEDKLLRYVSMTFMILVCGYIFYSLYQFVYVQQIPLFSITSPLVFSFLVGVTLFICLVINGIREYRIIREMNGESTSADKMNFRELLKVMGALIIIVLYVILMRQFSFRPVTVVYLFVSMVLLNQLNEALPKKAIKAALAAIVTVPVVYYIFNGIFLVMLP